MIKKRVSARVKTKAASFGFIGEELKSVVDFISDNLDSDEATDEDIDAQIDAVLPLLKLGQQQAQRIAKAKTTPTSGDDEKSDDGNGKSTKQDESKDAGEMVKMLQAIQILTGEVAALKTEKTVSTRRGKLEKLLKDSGKFGERTLKGFDRMKFDTEEEFEEFFTEVESDLEDHIKDEGSAGLPAAPVGGSTKSGNNKELTDKEIDELASLIN